MALRGPLRRAGPEGPRLPHVARPRLTLFPFATDRGVASIAALFGRVGLVRHAADPLPTPVGFPEGVRQPTVSLRMGRESQRKRRERGPAGVWEPMRGGGAMRVTSRFGAIFCRPNNYPWGNYSATHFLTMGYIDILEH